MTAQTYHIAPTVALTEAQALIEHYRNRNLILSQAVADLRDQLAAARADQEPVAPVTAEDAQ